MQRSVREFRTALGMIVGDSLALRDEELSARLIEEEAAETAEAIRAGDLVGAIDGLCDLLYVTFGAAVAFGANIQEPFNLVQATNMKKVGGPVREDGKRLKPEGWMPPDIVGWVARERASRPQGKEEPK